MPFSCPDASVRRAPRERSRVSCDVIKNMQGTDTCDFRN